MPIDPSLLNLFWDITLPVDDIPDDERTVLLPMRPLHAEVAEAHALEVAYESAVSSIDVIVDNATGKVTSKNIRASGTFENLNPGDTSGTFKTTIQVPAGRRSFTKAVSHTPILLEAVKRMTLATKRATKELEVWQLSMQGHVSKPPALLEQDGNTERLPEYSALLIPRKQAEKWLAIFGYCPYAAAAMAGEAQFFHAHVFEHNDDHPGAPDLHRYVTNAFGPDVGAWFEKNHTEYTAPITWTQTDRMFPQDFQDRQRIEWLHLTRVVVIAAIYHLYNTGKLPGLLLPPPNTGISKEGDTVSVHYWEAGQKYTLPLTTESFLSKNNQAAFAEYKLKHTEAMETSTALDRIFTLWRKMRFTREGIGSDPLTYLELPDISSIRTIEDVKSQYRRAPDVGPAEKALLDWLDTRDTLSWLKGYRFDGRSASPIEQNLREKILEVLPPLLEAYHHIVTIQHQERAVKILKAKQRTEVSQRAASLEAFAIEHGSRFERFPSEEKMIGLPAHFAAIPSDLNNTLRVAHDNMGKPALYTVNRHPLLDDTDMRVRPHLEFDIRPENAAHLVNSVVAVFGNRSQPMWIIPMLLSATLREYRLKGGHDTSNSVRITVPELIDWMRPNARKNARNEAFGKNHNATQLITHGFNILEHLTFNQITKAGKSQVNGLVKVWKNGMTNNGVCWFDLGLAPDILEGLYGPANAQRFMYHNTDSMRTYKGAELFYNPAAQLALEQLASMIIYRTDAPYLVTQKDDPWKVESIATHLGLLRNSTESHDQFRKRVESVLDTQTNAGTLASWKYHGTYRSKAEYLGNKVEITFGDDLFKMNQLTKTKKALAKIDDTLVRPGFQTETKRRGRKPKA